MDKLPFDKYKPYLVDYLRMNGIDANLGKNCTCPWHDDSTASFSVFIGKDGFPAFNCFAGCGGGDIYNAVEKITGETDSKKQFEEIERIFGNGTASPLPVIQKKVFTEEDKKDFIPDSDALGKFTDWLKAFPHSSDYILGYFAKRAAVSSKGKIQQYPHEILRKLLPYFLWYPGKKEAIDTFGIPTLLKAGLPYSKKDGKVVDYNSMTQFPPKGEEGKIYVALNTDTCYFWNGSSYEKYKEEPRKLSWWSEGVVTPTNIGYKLFFYCYDKEKQKEVSKKYNPRSVPLLFADELKDYAGKTIVILEGEMDAIVCRASGIENVFATGGLNGLSKPKIKRYIIPASISEIILFADKDSGEGEHPFRGQKKFGIMPLEKKDGIRESLPEQLLTEGYKGKIRVTVLPDDCPFKDPDEAILNGRLDLVQAAIENAKDYVAPEKPAKSKRTRKSEPTDTDTESKIDGTIYKTYDTVPLKFFKSILKKMPYGSLQEDDKRPFLCAAYKACRDDGATDALLDWCDSELNEKELKENAKDDYTPFYLLKLLAKYEISAYYITKLEELLVPAKEILRLFALKETIISIDYEKALESKKLQVFLDKKGNFTAADFLADVTDGNIIYVIEDKTNYAYNGLKWCVVPDLASAAHDILQNILIKYLEKNLDQKDFINKVLGQIDSRRFRTELVHDFNGLEQIAFGKSVEKEIMFDSIPIRATLTLSDGVIDFSGDKLKKRKAQRNEYRRKSLPYTVADVMKAPPPEKFISLMKSNFKQADEDTLRKNPVTTVETLMYYLSLIQSRDTSRRYGGFFLGTGGTGKSTLLKIIDAIYPGCTTALNSELLVTTSKHFDNPNGPTPEKAKLEGMLFGYISETPERGKLNETAFKSLTGGDKLTARTLHKDPHDFYQTAQIGIASNNSPSFSSTETATIDRMMIFRFNVRHEKGLKDSKTPEELIEWLRPEFPGIIKYFAEKYIDLNINLKGNIPLSTECINEKGLYVDAQANDTDRFIQLCLWFDMNNKSAFIPSKDLYSCYLLMLKAFYNKEFLPDSKETPSQRQFTTWLKTRVEFQNTWKQMRVPNSLMPEWGFEHVAFTDYAKELMQNEPQKSDTLNFTAPATTNNITPPPEDDPFADATPVNPPPPENDGNDGEQYDIF